MPRFNPAFMALVVTFSSVACNGSGDSTPGGLAGSNGAGTAGTGGAAGQGGNGTGAGGASGNGGAAGQAGASGSGGQGGGGAAGADGGGGSTGDSCANVPSAALVSAWTGDDHFCLIRYATGVPRARQIAFAPNGDLFVATAAGQLVVIFDVDGDGVSSTEERSSFATVMGGNHGLAVTPTHVYASSASTVFRWSYTPGQRVAMGAAETVVRGMPTGGHDARTLLIDGLNRLYVNIGSAGNVDAPAGPMTPPASRALIRRFDLANVPAGGFEAAAGEVFASGLRNETALTLDGQGRIWGVENGRDNLRVDGDAQMYNDNPGEEVHVFDPAGASRNYGYPFCWSEGLWSGPTAKGPGTQHLDPNQPGGFTEATCQDSNIVVPPVFVMRAHLAPLDIVEYVGSAYPAEYRRNLFVTSHGSWNRDNTRGHVGRLIIRLRMGSNGLPTQADNFMGELSGGALREGTWALRPVSIRVDAAGLLTFSDDASGTVHKIGYRP
jgi:glucose/arabinose dehydrogenase